MGTGLMSLGEFEHQVQRFVSISNEINDGWHLARAHHGAVYMVKKCIVGPAHIDGDVSNVSGSSGCTGDNKTTTEPSSSSNTSSIPQTSSALPPPSATQCLSQTATPKTSEQFGAPFGAAMKSPPSEITQASHALSEDQHHYVVADSVQSSHSEEKDRHPQQQQPLASEVPFATHIPVSWKEQDPTALPEERSHSQQTQMSSGVAKENLSLVQGKNEEAVGKHMEDILEAEEMDPSLHEMDMDSDTEDEVCVSTAGTQRTIFTYEYHVVYSESYSVPVLYFNIFTPDGKLLPLAEVWNLCPPSFQAYIKDNKWATLTQQEHPLLGRPYLQLHPCHTADLMAQVASGDCSGNSMNYLATWLSTVGPLIALKISPAYVCSNLE